MSWKRPELWVGIASAAGAIVGLTLGSAQADQAIHWGQVVGTVGGVIVMAAGAFVAGVRKGKSGKAGED